MTLRYEDDREALEVAATVIKASGAATEGVDRMRGDRR